MALTMTKAATDLISMLKKQKFPDEPKKTYWNILTEQIAEEGTWDDDLIDQVKEEIANWLSKLKKNDLNNLWDESESADEYDEDLPDNETIIDELSDELLDNVLNKIEDSTPREEYFIPEATSSKKKKDEDDDFDDDFKDDIFDDDDLDGFDDGFFEDDDRY
jgi:Na+/phosphate symporter